MSGSTVYPAALDNFDVDHGSSEQAGPDLEDARAAINAIETELGPNPSGASADVQDRLDAVDAAVAAKQASDADLTAIAALTPSNDDAIQRKGGVWVARSMAQVKTDLALVKGDVGLGNVDNTSDANKPVSAAQAAADALAVPKSLVDAKGDTFVGTAADTLARRAVGANGQVFTADSAEVDGVKWATPDVTQAELDAVAEATPTVEELVAGVTHATVTATASVPVFYAPFACEIKQMALVNQNTTIAASDTNYWQVSFRKNATGQIVVKTTQVTGGEAVTSRVPWTFDAVAFSFPENAILAAGDHIDCAFSKIAAAANWVGPILIQVRYEPI